MSTQTDKRRSFSAGLNRVGHKCDNNSSHKAARSMSTSRRSARYDRRRSTMRTPTTSSSDTINSGSSSSSSSTSPRSSLRSARFTSSRSLHGFTSALEEEDDYLEEQDLKPRRGKISGDRASSGPHNARGSRMPKTPRSKTGSQKRRQSRLSSVSKKSMNTSPLEHHRPRGLSVDTVSTADGKMRREEQTVTGVSKKALYGNLIPLNVHSLWYQTLCCCFALAEIAHLLLIRGLSYLISLLLADKTKYPSSYTKAIIFPVESSVIP
ncbi:unnamed protein product [Protopolystoma xenopodis]|uniref:Uncharacterized protein n=1 Tax=Protopolystoma xenopodis TaxID=117903 RepID=A0A3S5CT47_9PLAT|nr:unnamed protein product [Protopolystoma xenopodis]